MPLPLIAGIGSLVGGAVFKVGQKIARYVLITVFIVAIGTVTYKLSQTYFTIYSTIQGSIDDLGVSYGGLIGCVLSTLGIDDFMTSTLAIFVTASVFWGLSVAYIIAFKVTKMTYKYMIKATE